MFTRYRLRAAVPASRIEEFFVWLDQHCAWTGYQDDDIHVSFVVSDPTAADRIAQAWPEVSITPV